MLQVNTATYLKNKKLTSCYLLFYCISYRLNIFRALLCPSSGARDYDVDYHIGEVGVLSRLQPGHYSNLTAPNLQPTAN